MALGELALGKLAVEPCRLELSTVSVACGPWLACMGLVLALRILAPHTWALRAWVARTLALRSEVPEDAYSHHHIC